ncbi:NAD(P)/FAD-dependent oxidoreductase [Sporichthya brevicatena]|uniref:NAD(P)/FAD-dependent oxidoreductase n=1 Tax=Sporichthya brevicatena TaxID=171442 RepID=A0ABN1G514_9ACTN
MSEYDVVIIGGGAAGLSAALTLGRARRTVLVVDGGAPRNAPAAHMYGFLSRDGESPAELLELGRAEVKSYGGEITTAVVAGIEREDKRFRVTLEGDRSVWGRRLLVATGLRDVLPEIPGLRERWARDVLHCPYCHGYEVRDQRLGVLGGGPMTAHYTQLIRQWSADVVLFAPAGSVPPADAAGYAARGIEVVEGAVTRTVVADDRLVGLEVDGRVVPVDAVFAAPRFEPNDALLRDLGCEVDADGWVVTDATGQTTVPGVWVAGNVANPRAQVIVAAGEGVAAAAMLNADLVAEEVADAVAA